jgi:hypothetical protein
VVLVGLYERGRKGGRKEGRKGGAYSADDIFMVAEVRLAVLAAVDLVAVQIDVVCETHNAVLLAGGCLESWRPGALL